MRLKNDVEINEGFKEHFVYNVKYAMLIIRIKIVSVKNQIFEFIKRNLILSLLFLIALTTIILYKLTNNIPEMFVSADFFFKLGSDLSLAYLGSFIFFIVQVYIPEYRRRESVKGEIINKLRLIEGQMHFQIYLMARGGISKYNIDITNMSHDDFARIVEDFDFTSESFFLSNDIIEQKLYLDSKGAEYKSIYLESKSKHKLHIDVMAKDIEVIKKEIHELFTYFDPYIDDKLRTVLFKILDSDYQILIQVAKDERKIKIGNTAKVIEDEDVIEEYYELYKELNEIMKDI